MGLLDFFKKSDINAETERWRQAPGGVLLDVRREEEYADGHIPGSLNLPLDEIARAEAVIPDKAAPLFIYCLSGGRSSRAAAELKALGYGDVRNIGGIRAYRGELETGIPGENRE